MKEFSVNMADGMAYLSMSSSKKLMSLLMGKSNSSCNAVSDESSKSSELEESETAIMSSVYDLQLLHSISSF